MGKIQHIQCLACGTPVPMVMQTTGMYEGTCPNCYCGATIVTDVRPRPRIVVDRVAYNGMFAMAVNSGLQETPHSGARFASRQSAP